MSSTQSQTFQFFPKLPPEVRIQVWKLSCTPRLVSMPWNPRNERYGPTNAPPATLHVNQEARYEAMKLYEQLIIASPFIGSTTTATFFSPSLDTIYFPRPVDPGYYMMGSYNMSTHLPNAFSLVRRLAIDHIAPKETRSAELFTWGLLIVAFRELEETYLVVSETMSAPDMEAVNAGEEFRLVDLDCGDPDAARRLMDPVMASYTHGMSPIVVSVVKENSAEGEGQDGSGREEVAPLESKYTWMQTVPLVPKVRLTIRY